MLTRRGVELEKARLSDRDVATIRRELTVAPVTLEMFPKRFKVYAETPTEYVVPRFWAQDKFEFCDVRPPATTWTHDFVGALRPDLRQPEAAAAAMDSIERHGGAIVNLFAGGGKTSLAIWIATELGRKTMILVHKNFLADQFEERIRGHVPTATITRIQGSTCDTSGDFVIVMIQTLMTRKYPAETFREFGLLVVDECHHAPAESFSQTLVGLAFPAVLGLSATPTRKDGLTRVMHWFLGPTAFANKRTNQTNVVVHAVNFKHPSYSMPPPMNKRGDIDYTGLVSRIVDLPDRTAAIADEAQKLAWTGRRVLVLSHRRGHATAIAEELRRRDVDAATYLGGDKDPPDAIVTCATYALAAEGYDDPRLNALVLATPSSDVNQACGRVLRGGGGDDPIIVDIVDHYSLFYSQFVKRTRFYRETGFAMNGAANPPNPVAAFVDDD
jgi:superfamily II DNA or RNA helicase